MGLIILAVVLIVAAGVGFYFMQSTKSELYAMIGAETLSIPELERQRGISDELGAQGGFRKVCEVVGAANPRAEGPLTAEISKAPCVWYRYEVERQYEHVEYRDGRRRRVQRTETVAEYTSMENYSVLDPQGNQIGVEPGTVKPEGVEQSVDRFVPKDGRGDGSFFGFSGFSFSSLLTGRDDTIGFHYREWVIRPGRQLYILGEVHDKYGPLVIGEPEDKGHHIVSMRSEDQLRAERTNRHKWLAVGVIVAFFAGVITLVFGIIRLL
jgi:hypothetical protein